MIKSKIISFLMIFLLIGSGTGFSAPEQAAASATQTPKEGYITMDFKDADITTVLRLLSVKSGMNIVAGPEVTGTVTVRLENVPWKEALEVVLRTYGYVYEKKDNIIRVTTRQNLALEELVTETFILEYIQLSKRADREVGKTTAQQPDGGQEILDIITTMLSERGKVKMVAQRNAVIVTDTPTHVYKISQVIEKLDQITPQAFIDSKIVKTQLDKGENLGIRWNPASMGVSGGASRPVTFPFSTAKDSGSEYFPGSLEPFLPRISGTSSGTGATSSGQVIANPNEPRAFPFPDPSVASRTFTFGTLDFTQFSALLSMLQSRTNTNVVSNPRIVVLNNQTAKVKVGSEIPIPSFEFNQQTASFQVTGFTYRDVGVVLNVTPHINSAEEILVDLKPEVSSLGATISFTSTLAAPSFDVTNAETQVLIRSGETIAIGGLLENKSSISKQQVPYLANLPFIGKAFRSKRQTEGSANRNVETIFFVTVTVIDTEGQPMEKTKAGKARSNVKVPLSTKKTVDPFATSTLPPAAQTPAQAGPG